MANSPNWYDLPGPGLLAGIANYLEPYLLGNNNHEQGYYIIPATANGANVSEADGDLFLLQSFTCPNVSVLHASYQAETCVDKNSTQPDVRG